jgi:hypothetical protein
VELDSAQIILSSTEKAWDDVWPSEGIATYFTLLVGE